ncbi:sulfotransferase family 2 domain-containing protein [Aestuariibaculum lutulentum]|uniref:Sulfotransferase family protein n=1 Tax=Aestuariibaculum lutulentum TaxID=2920935 RepID=A0ABS9RFH3_9FLAO|nr:sulfotransferase family 2 domain-containing protein [Aestuariibaculum lutulentum]MCH4551246.1 sulfotransferase family protein [Aestuariibaculum lutulentum]
MISHEHKCIFIHIPKTAGSSIKECLFKGKHFNWRVADYNYLYGWCPKRRLHLQHATSKQLLETELITEHQWNTYYKFAFIRNPWDRAYSDYIWLTNDCGIKDSFYNFILKQGKFKELLRNNETMMYRGDHLCLQSSFFDKEGEFSLDFVGKFENFKGDFESVKKYLKITDDKEYFEKKSKQRLQHYSLFYTKTKQELIERVYFDDIINLGYSFKDQKKGIFKLKNFF